MILHLEDPEIDELAQKLADLRKVPKMEAVRAALRHEMKRLDSAPELSEVDTDQQVAEALAIARALRSNGLQGSPADRHFIDSLYEG